LQAVTPKILGNLALGYMRFSAAPRLFIMWASDDVLMYCDFFDVKQPVPIHVVPTMMGPQFPAIVRLLAPGHDQQPQTEQYAEHLL